MSGLVGVPPISVSLPECLFGRFSLIWGLAEDFIAEMLWVEAQIHYPLCFGRVRWWYIFP